MPSAELEKAVNERGISSRTMRTAKSRIGDKLVTEKDGTAWVCYLRAVSYTHLDVYKRQSSFRPLTLPGTARA